MADSPGSVADPPLHLSFTRAELDAAAALIHPVVPPTPQYCWPKLARRLGCELWVKHENHTPTGAFKIRGGLVYMEALRREQPSVTEVVSATRGNHGQSIALSAARAGLRATIFVPNGNSPDHNSAMSAFGAAVIEQGKDFDQAREAAQEFAHARGAHLVPSFHRHLVLGVATYALELFSAAPPLDCVYVGVGMGSGICGLMAVRHLLGLPTAIVGVSAAGAPANALSHAAGKVVTTESALTIADGLATRQPDRNAVAAICAGVERFVTVTEDEILSAMGVYFDDTHQVAEGAAAAALAAVIQDRERLAGKRVGVIFSGGNIERRRFLLALNGDRS